MNIITTERLILRELLPKDYPDLCGILQDPDVMYAYEHAFTNEEVTDWLQRQQLRYKNYGFGLWAVLLKPNNTFIGQCGITPQPYNDKEVLEIGYLFKKAFWGQGYATEAATVCKYYAFKALKVKEIYSIIRDNNIPSQKVALRNGMLKIDTIVKHYHGMDMPHYVYKVSSTTPQITQTASLTPPLI